MSKLLGQIGVALGSVVTFILFDVLHVVLGFWRDLLKSARLILALLQTYSTELNLCMFYAPEIILGLAFSALMFSMLTSNKVEQFQLQRSLLRTLNFLWKSTGSVALFHLFLILVGTEKFIDTYSWLAFDSDRLWIKLFMVGIFSLLYWIYLSTFKSTIFSQTRLDQLSLLLLGQLCSCLLINSQDLIFMGLSLTGLNIVIYVLIALTKTQRSIEASIKYFIMGIISTYFYLLGSFILWVEFGTTVYTEISSSLIAGSTSYLAAFGLVLIISGFLLKLGVAPYYFWTVDIYDGSPMFLFGYITLIIKTAVFTTLVHFLAFFESQGYLWQPLLVSSGLLSLVVGTIGALLQQRIKRFFAYSSIAHLGFILLVLGNSTVENLWVNYPYYFVYAISTALLFGTLVGIRHSNGQEITYFTELGGIVTKKPLVGWLLLGIFLSFAGIPPFTGFFVKYLVILLSFEANQYFSLIVILGLLAVTTYNYLRLIKNLYFQVGPVRLQLWYRWPAGWALIFLILFLSTLSPGIWLVGS